MRGPVCLLLSILLHLWVLHELPLAPSFHSSPTPSSWIQVDRIERAQGAMARENPSKKKTKVQKEQKAQERTPPTRPSTGGGPNRHALSHPGPTTLYRPPPVYPPASLAKQEQGRVLLEVKTDDRGRVISIQLLKSSGFPRLDEAAQRTVEQWRLYRHAHLQIPIHFKIR